MLSLKTEANADFNGADYLAALNKYTSIIELATDIDFKEQLTVLHCNKGICFTKMVLDILFLIERGQKSHRKFYKISRI